ncbi:MAG: hypothetical protein IKB16_09055 [Lentisphaeria bacterium]|nr:hypothetical protein [Lentisphaeria bacterium]
MIDTAKLRWGLRPVKQADHLAVWGARATFAEGELYFMPDRQEHIGDTVPVCALTNWINDTALPALKQHIKETNWSNDSKEIFTLSDSLFTLKASANGSYGYMYLTATLQGTDELPTGKWSGKNIPKIGDTISAKINNLGKCYVLGYLLQDEWISVIAKPLNPPEWFIKQNGKSALATLFGAEIE